MFFYTTTFVTMLTALGPSFVTPSAAAPEEKGLDDLSRHFLAIAEEAREASNLEQLTVVVDVGADVYFSWGSGSDPGVSVDANSRFPVGSMTEQLVAVAVLSLAEEGEVALEDPIAEYLPPFEESDSKITIHHLLSHASGMPALEDVLEPDELAAGMDEVVARLAKVPLEGQPGRCFLFSNANVVLLGAILEEATRAEIPHCLKERVFGPLEMEDSGYCTEDEYVKRSFHEFSGGTAGDLAAAPLFRAGCLCSTAMDLVRFQRGLVEHDIFGDELWERMVSPNILDDGTYTGFGYGMSITALEDQRGFSFGGRMYGASSHVAYYPDLDATIVVLASGEEAPVEGIERNIARALFDLPDLQVHDLPLEEEERLRYVGSYELGCIRLLLTEQDGRLALEVFEDRGLLLKYQGGHRFIAADDTEVRLEFDLQGSRAESVTLSYHGTQLRARRVD